jgi:aminocarboxymuconate-semialdehyde decarboxylase
MIIDCHGHIVPVGLLEALRAAAGQFGSVRMIEEGDGLAFSFAGNAPTRPVAKPLSDLAARTRWMGEQGIERAVVGGWLDMFGYDIPSDQGIAWSALTNQHLLAAAKQDPRFVPLATVPMQSGKDAARVLGEAMDAGFPGAMIGTQPKGVGGVLDDPDLAPFWETAHARSAVVFRWAAWGCPMSSGG